MSDSLFFGKKAEDIAVAKMESEGYTLLCRNFCVHNVGELDIVMLKDEEVYVCEVKARKFKSDVYGYPEEAITFTKRRKIYKTTEYMLQKYNLNGKNVNFLAISVYANDEGLVQNVEILPF